MFKHLAPALLLSLAIAGVAAPALAAAADEPSISQIYQAAEAGRFSDADAMIAKVLQDHPRSAKAHFVHAELLAKEGKAALARNALARAEELAPGLPFAKAASVATLRRSLASGDTPRAAATQSMPSAQSPLTRPPEVAAAREPVKATGGMGAAPWALGGLGVLALVFWLRRRKPAVVAPTAPVQPYPYPGAMAAGPGPAVPAGPAGMAAMGGMPGGFGAPSYAGGYGGQPQQAPQAPVAPASPGMGLGGALMTGAAVGLGAVVVGQAVRHFTQPDGLANNPGTQAASSQGAQAANNPLPSFANDLGPASGADMGGNDFGINDTASWDSNADSGSGGGGSDWE